MRYNSKLSFPSIILPKINANITKAMDGTRGVLTFPSEVERRLPNPLSSIDTGIIKVKNFKCN